MSTPTKQMIARKGLAERSQAVYRPPSSPEAGPSSPQSPPHTSSTNPTENEEYGTSTPPPYSGPISPLTPPSDPSTSTTLLANLSPVPAIAYPGLPHLNYTLYHPPTFTLSTDTKTLSSHSPHLSSPSSAASLCSLLQKLAQLPPKPQIWIVGKNGKEVDFDVRINCMNVLVPEDEKRRMNYVKVIGKGELGHRGGGRVSIGTEGEGELGLGEWCERFCQENRGIKSLIPHSFTLERTVQNWDTTYLQGRLLTLIHSTSYRGHVTISFPITHSKVTLHSPDKLNRFFTSVTKVFTGVKKYEVVKSVWPYADVERGTVGGEGRRCVVQDEEEWFGGWSDAIRHAVIAKRRGWVTIEDQLEFLMEPKEGEAVKGDWGAQGDV